MKNLLFTILLIILSFVATAQLSANYNVTLPQGASPVISSTNLMANESAKYKTNALPDFKRHFYTVEENITAGFWDVSVSKDLQKTADQRLSELKWLSALGSPKNPSTFSTAVFNDINYIIEKYQRNSSNYIRFYSDYYKDQMISGVIQFNDKDQQNANGLLIIFLNGIQRK